MGLLQKKVAKAASSFFRSEGGAIEETISSTESILHSITMSGDGAVGTLIVSNGAAATPANILVQLEMPSGEAKTFIFNVKMSNGIRVTPGEATTDSVIIYDAG